MTSLCHSHPGIRGKALLLVLTVLAIVGGLLAGAFHFTGSMAHSIRREGVRNQVDAAAQAGVEFLFAHWKQFPATHQGQLPDADALAGVPRPSPALHPVFLESGITFDKVSFEIADPWGAAVGAGNPHGHSSAKSIHDQGGFAQPHLLGLPGWAGRGVHYRAEVQVSGPRSSRESSPPTATVVRYFQAATVPIFQALMFWESDLELHPSDALTLQGKIHTNGDAWLVGHGPIHLLDRISYAGEYHEQVSPARAEIGAPTELPRWSDGLPSGSSLSKPHQLSKVDRIEFFGVPSATLFDKSDANPNNDSFRELIEPSDPASPDPAVIAERRLSQLANVIISVDGGEIAVSAGIKHPSLDAASSAAIRAAVGETVGLYDPSRAAEVSTTNIDVAALSEALLASAGRTARGELPEMIIYLLGSRDGTTAFRLTNGAEIACPLTFASPHAVYVHGDFNTGGGVVSSRKNSGHDATRVPSNDAGNPEGNDSSTSLGYTKQPVAIIADSITVVSNAWLDGNAKSGLSNRIASHTTINAAIITGRRPGNEAHQLLNFVENWQNKDLTYHGSMVQLFDSVTATEGNPNSAFVSPQNRWSHDRSLVVTPPPGRFEAAVFIRGRWVSQ